MSSVFPFSDRGLRRSGVCGLCGTDGPLSDTHVPPRCSGNDGAASPLVIRRDMKGSAALGPGRSRTGGSRAYLLCAPCNSRVGRWDACFCDFCTSLGSLLQGAQGQTSRVPVVGDMTAGRPGAIVRSLLGGMFAINGELRERWPEVSGSIVSGEPIDEPADARLLLELYLGGRAWASGGGAKVELPEGRVTYVHAELVWPPLHVVLTDGRSAGRWPGAMDISSWLRDSGAAVRRVSFSLPAVDEEALWAQFRA